jgi:hypothetical protein
MTRSSYEYPSLALVHAKLFNAKTIVSVTCVVVMLFLRRFRVCRPVAGLVSTIPYILRLPCRGRQS